MKNNNPFFSIIVPVYNSEKHILTFLKSVLKQDYQEFELILIDDGSTDSSGRICDSISIRDNRIKVIHKSNSGICDTRNLGIKLCKGDYCIFFDNDDIIQQHYFRSIAKIVNKYKCDIIVSGYKYIQTNKKNKTINEISVKDDNHYIYSNNEVKNYFVNSFGKTINPVWNKVYSVAFLKTNNMFFDTQYKMGMEDIDFNVRAFNYAERIYVSSFVGYKYFIRDGASTSRKYNSNVLRDNIRLFSKIDNYYHDFLTNDIIKDKFQYFFIAPLENESILHKPNYIKVLKNKKADQLLDLIKKEKSVFRLNAYQMIIYYCVINDRTVLLHCILKLKMLIRNNRSIFRFLKQLLSFKLVNS